MWTFLKALARPFALRHLWRFLRRNWWGLIGILAYGFYLFWTGYDPLMGTWPRGEYPDAELFHLESPKFFDINHTAGIPRQAIDPAGHLVPIFGRVTKDNPDFYDWWAIWDLKKQRTLMAGRNNSTIQNILFNQQRNEILICMVYGRENHNHQSIHHRESKILVLDAETGKFKRTYRVPRMTYASNFSPDGRYLAGSGHAWMEYMNEQPVILDLETGRVRRVPILANISFFEANDQLILTNYYCVLRYDLRNKKISMVLNYAPPVSDGESHFIFSWPQKTNLLDKYFSLLDHVSKRSNNDNSGYVNREELLSIWYDGSGKYSRMIIPKRPVFYDSPSNVLSIHQYENNPGKINDDHTLMILRRIKVIRQDQEKAILFLIDLRTGRDFPFACQDGFPDIKLDSSLWLDKYFNFVRNDLIGFNDG